jgi:hypothetical protein
VNQKLRDFLNSGLGLLVLGFVLTTLCGGAINAIHEWSSFRRDKQFELLKGELAKHEVLLVDLTKVVGARTFRLQRVLWAMDPEAKPASETWQLTDDAKKRLNKSWDEYYDTVVDWNLNYRNYATKIRVLAGDEIANRFFTAGDSGARRSKSETVCGSFEQAHDVIGELKKEAALTSKVDREKHHLAQQRVDELYDKVDDFVANLYRALGDKERADDFLKPSRR